MGLRQSITASLERDIDRSVHLEMANRSWIRIQIAMVQNVVITCFRVSYLIQTLSLVKCKIN